MEQFTSFRVSDRRGLTTYFRGTTPGGKRSREGHMVVRRQKQGIHESVSEEGTNTCLGVTKGGFKNCVS